MKLVLISLLLFVNIIIVKGVTLLPRYDTLSITGVDDNTCSRLFTLDQCQDICGSKYMQFISSESETNQVEYGYGASCDSILTKVSFPCDPEVNTTFTININDKEYKYSPKCSCIDKSKCTGFPSSQSSDSKSKSSSSTQSSDSSDSDTQYNIPMILSSAISFLTFLFIIN